jgi:hypothetical protein
LKAFAQRWLALKVDDAVQLVTGTVAKSMNALSTSLFAGHASHEAAPVTALK